MNKNKFIRNLKFKNKLVLNTSVILYMFLICTGLLILLRASGVFSNMSQQIIDAQINHLHNNILNEVQTYEKAIQFTLISNTLDDILSDSIEEDEPIETTEMLRSFINSQSSSYLYPLNMHLYVDDKYNILTHENLGYINSIREETWYKMLQKYTYNRIIWYYDPQSKNEYINGEFICAVGIPSDESGQIHAYVKMAVNADFIFEIINETINDLDDVVIVYNMDDEVIWTSNESSDKYFASAGDFLASDLYSLSENNLHYYTFTTTDLEIQVVYIHQVEAMMLQYMGFIQYSITVVVIVLVFSMVILLFSANLLTKRLSSLNKQVQMIDENNLHYENTLSGNDEFSKLSRSFENLINRINNLINRIRSIEEEKTMLEFKALQEQISPHFLYNSLSVINALACEIEADNISEAIKALAEFYRLFLSNGNNIIPIRDELKMLKCYIKICSIRYQNNLSVKIEVDENAINCKMPRLILQPFIENSAFHGFYTNLTVHPEILLKIKNEDGLLTFTISDNGKGIAPDRLDIIRRGDGGYAISNIDRRLKLIYGSQYGILIKSAVAKGTSVIITIPAEEIDMSLVDCDES